MEKKINIEDQIFDLSEEKSMPPLWEVGEVCIYNCYLAWVLKTSQEQNKIVSVETLSGIFDITDNDYYCPLTIENYRNANFINGLFGDVPYSRKTQIKKVEFFKRMVEATESQTNDIKLKALDYVYHKEYNNG